MSKDLPRSMFTKNYPRKAFKSQQFCFTPLLEFIEKLSFEDQICQFDEMLLCLVQN